MKLTLLAALLSLTSAAPVKYVTRVHTAPAVTEWQTHTTNTVTKVNTVIETANAPPPENTDVNKAPTTSTTPTTPTTSTTPPTTSTTPTSTPAPAPTTSSPAPVPTTSSAPAPAPASSETDTINYPSSTEIVPTTSSTPAAPTTSSSSSSSSSPTTTWWTPTTSSTTPATTSTTPTTTSTTPTTTSTPTTSSTSTTPTTSSTSSSAPTETGSSNLDDFQQAILDEHNVKRDLHGVQHLTWDDTLAQYAADYAAKSFSCDNVQLIHSQGPYGENLAAGYSGGKSPVDAWYDEIKDYNYDQPGFSEKTGHFTQLVWKSTSRVGCAKVACDNAWKQYTICEYSDSRGNVVGTDPATGESYFAENVVRPVS